MHPDGFQVTFKQGGPSEYFEAIVTRHGPERIQHDAWGTDPVRAPEAALAEFGFSPAKIRAARAKWTDLAKTRRVTDELVVEPSNAEAGLRSRSRAVLPAIGGRTVIGMLSRLVSNVCPEENADQPRGILTIEQPLVADDAASLLVHVSDRILQKTTAVGQSEDPEHDGSWRLGCEINRASAVEVIWAADQSLSTLWGITPGQISDLERNWILPRSPWSTRRAIRASWRWRRTATTILRRAR